jgi:gliding motility-associated-like protein
MSNQTVYDCDGILYDSDAGPGGDYGHNENFVFTICVPQASSINLNWNSFCTEAVLDYIMIYDGPTTGSPLLGGPYSGATAPPSLTATSGCLTISFVSDANVACWGWEAEWHATVPPPIEPTVTNLSGSCGSNIIDLSFDVPVHCDSVDTVYFELLDPPGFTILDILPNPCTNDSATDYQIVLNNPVDDCEDFEFDFELHIPDACDSVYIYDYFEVISITDCPLEALPFFNTDTICENGCAILEADGDGGDCNYTYTWLNGLPTGPGPYFICATQDSTIGLVINDGAGNPPDTTYITLTVMPLPEAGPDTLICSNDPAFLINTGTPLGGTWSGPGIQSPGGWFDPDSAGIGIHWLYYSVDGCADSLQLEVLEIDAGPAEASCEGAAPFNLSGMTPPGGYWTGPYVDSMGVFNPQLEGSFIVTYYFGDCSDTKIVNVDSIVLQNNDTICETDPIYGINVTPFGGVWTGTGIIDSLQGLFDPDLAGGGDHSLAYQIQGCRDTLDIHVTAINAGSNRVSCPYAGNYTLPSANPAGGYWSGWGIIDSLNGIFDPTVNNYNNFTEELIYHANGCTDTIIMYVRVTNIGIPQLEMCINDGSIALNWTNVQRSPGNGNWSGAGITDPNYPGTFDPVVAGPGNHLLHYNANGCVDSMNIIVYDQPEITDTIICEADGQVTLSVDVSGGTWSGPGIVDAVNGVFDPSITDDGWFWIYYQTFGACMDSIILQVDSMPEISLAYLDSNYCMIDSVVDMQWIPLGGFASGPGIIGDDFNPWLAGTGVHELTYEVANGTCRDYDTIYVSIGDTLRSFQNFSDSVLCYSDYATLQTTAQGGNGGPYTYQWSHGLAAVNSHLVGPIQSSQIFTVTVTDGCSQPSIDSFFVAVQSEIQTSLSASDTVCYDSLGFANISAPPGNSYQFTWQTTPPLYGNAITTTPGTYYVITTDTTTGCYRWDTIVIPGYPQIAANFSVFPQEPCYLLSQAHLEMIDFSFGGNTGYWNYGDGSPTETYIQGAYPQHSWSDTGQFTISLYIENNGGCYAMDSLDICIELDPNLYVPNAFSPNGDIHNQTFYCVAGQITQWHLSIWDRWGKFLWESFDIDVGWDGTWEGMDMPDGTYVYKIVYRFEGDKEDRLLQGTVHLLR